jgi:hypothetical protein
MFLSLLPPMPLLPRLVLGLVAAILAGILNLVFCRARWRLGQFILVIFVAPMVVYLASVSGLSSGQRTDCVILGAIVGILVVRGSQRHERIPSFRARAIVLLMAVVVLGPATGLVFHYLRYLAGWVTLDDSWEIRLSLQDGIVASVAGSVLAVLMITLASRRAAETDSL